MMWRAGEYWKMTAVGSPLIWGIFPAKEGHRLNLLVSREISAL
jgi:hypothetical protein